MAIKYQQGEPRVVSPEDKSFYLENGYLIIGGLFTSDECDEVFDRLRFYQNSDGAPMLNLDREYEISGYAQGKIAEKRGIPFEDVPVEDIPFEHIIETAGLIRRFVRDPRSVSILEQLHQGEYEERSGRRPLRWGVVMNQILFKEKGTRYANQAWSIHQDNSYVLNPNGLYVTTNTFFADSHVENGTMFVYPGSQRERLLPFEEAKSFREERGKNPGNVIKVPDKYERVDLEFKKGDVLFLNGDLAHGSYPNKSKTRSRPLFSACFIPEGEFFRPGKASRKMFQSLR